MWQCLWESTSFEKNVVQHPVYPYLACPSGAVLCSNADFATCYCFIMPFGWLAWRVHHSPRVPLEKREREERDDHPCNKNAKVQAH